MDGVQEAVAVHVCTNPASGDPATASGRDAGDVDPRSRMDAVTSIPDMTRRTRALVAFGLSTAILGLGVTLAARHFPGGLDWVYTVVSAVASRRHNPHGARYLAAALTLALPLLWPAVSWIAGRDRAESGIGRFGLRALRAGILLGALVGVERLVFYRFSEIVPKGHEVLALAC